jgi:hypothetical protein
VWRLRRLCFGRPGGHPVFRLSGGGREPAGGARAPPAPGARLTIVKLVPVAVIAPSPERRRERRLGASRECELPGFESRRGVQLQGRMNLHRSTCFSPAYPLRRRGIFDLPPKTASFQAIRGVEPTGIEPVTSCLQRSPSKRANWHDLLGIHPSGPQRNRAKARFVCRHFSGRWSTEVDAWTSAAAAEPRVLLGATDAPRGVNARR